MDLRQRVAQVRDEGQTIAQVAERFSVSTSFVEKLQQRRRESGTLAPKPHAGGRQPALTDAHDEALRALLAAKPDTTLVELRERLGVKVHLSTLWYRLKRLGLTFKKNTESGRARARGRTRPTPGLARGASDAGSSAIGIH
jgi:transposase